MAAKQLISVTTGAYVSVSATIYAEYVEIQEDGSGTQSGLKVKFPSDNFTAVYEYQPSAQPIRIGIPLTSGHAGRAQLVGKPSRTVPVPKANGTYSSVTEPATVYAQIEALTGNTVIRVDERP